MQVSQPPPTDQVMKQALAQQQAGRLQEAFAFYEEVLRVEPGHAEALRCSGKVAYRLGRTERGVSLIKQAAELEPGRADYFFDLAQALEGIGELDGAIAAYRQAIVLDQKWESAHCKLGQTLLKKGLPAEALTSFSQAMSINPASCEGAMGLGAALDKLGRLEQSIVCFRKAIAIEPAFAEAHNSMGRVLNTLGRFDEAIACFQQALALRPDSADVMSNLGGTLRSSGDLPGAVEYCLKAIALRPNHISAHLNLANVYKDQGFLAQAVHSYRRAIAAAPEKALAHTNLATTLLEQDRIPEAIESYENAIAIGTDQGTAYSNLLYLYSFTGHGGPAVERAFAEGWEKIMLTDAERAAARERASVFPMPSRQGRKLRLGIVSAELGFHAVAVFLRSFLDHLDRSKFHLTLFPTVRWSDAVARHFQELADNYIPLMGIPDERAAAGIRKEEIDILIDTTGHTSTCRLGIFAHRAAPVQCSYIGYWSTTGLTEMDWYITDEDYSRGCETHFTERLWRLPQMAHCYTGDQALPESAWAPDADGTVWLGCFNRYNKMRRETLRVWATVMNALPNARLLLEDRAGNQEETHERIRSALSCLGVAQDRVTFLPAVPGLDFARHMLLYDRVDIAIDTWPFNSGTTAFDTLWMGVPLVALEGTRISGRMSSSILRALGKPEWVAQSEEEYVAIIRKLASDVEGRKELRRSLRSSMLRSSLCDAKGLTRVLEDALGKMYDRVANP